MDKPENQPFLQSNTQISTGKESWKYKKKICTSQKLSPKGTEQYDTNYILTKQNRKHQQKR